MKRIFLTSLIALISITAVNAYEYSYMLFTNNDGTTATISVENLTFTVSDGVLLVENGQDRNSFTLTDLSSMKFVKSSSDVISSKIEHNTEIQVYDLSGRSLGSYSNENEASLSLEKGMYIIVGSQIKKICVK